MLAALVRFCVREPLIVLLLTAGLIGFGIYSVNTVPIDAIPDVGEKQVIVLTDWPGRSPKDVEDQITYPLSVNLLAVPEAKSVRGKSLFGVSFVQVTFPDAVDFYWARSRVSEQLGVAAASLPDGVIPRMGPDATGLGQIYYYVLEPPPLSPDGTGGVNLAELRSLQDFVVRYELQAVEGVSEVAGIGGYVRQYQVDVDPDRLRFHQLPLDRVTAAVQAAGRDVGAKTVESGGMEYIVRGRGFIGGEDGDAVRDLEETVVAERDGVPVRLKDVADVQLGPDFRRGGLDFNGSEAVGGVVVMRHGENPRAVIDRVKAKIRQIEPSLNGVTIRGVYDRSGLIDETIDTLATALWQEIAITAAVILLFLLHIRSSLTVAATLPVAVLLAFGAMRLGGVDANVMSLAGIAIAIGTMVDMGIIVSENIYQHLADWRGEVEREELRVERNEDGEGTGRRVEDSSPAASSSAHSTLDFSRSTSRSRVEVIEEAAGEVAPAVFTAVTTTVVSFLPVFFLTGRDHRLFAPLAWTKTFSIVAALIVAVCLVPPICRLLLSAKPRSRWFGAFAGLAGAAIFGGTAILWAERAAGALTAELFPGGDYAIFPVHVVLAAAAGGFATGYLMSRERLRPVEENPVSRLVVGVYEPTLRFVLRHKIGFLTLPAFIVALGLGAWFGLGTILKPVERGASYFGADLNAVPGYLDMKSQFMGLPSDDWIALDEGSWFYMPSLTPAASFDEAMRVLQTQDVLIGRIPEVKDVLGKIGRIDSALDPAPAAMVETYVMLHPRDRWRPGVTSEAIWEEINAVATLPGVTPAGPLQPIEGRVVMLQSGIKASTAVRIYGDDLGELATAARSVAARLRTHPFVDAGTVNPDIVLGKPYVEFAVDREAAARYGMNVEMVNRVIETALGGMNVDRTVEGRERYPVRVRYRRDLRDGIEELPDLPVVTHAGETVPLSELATLTTTWGPGAISSENARLVAHVAFAVEDGVGDLEAVAAVEASLRAAAAKSPGAADRLDLPAGYSFELVGNFRNQIEANRRLMWLVPLVIGINLLLIYFQFRAVPLTLAVFAGIPVAFGGGMICLALAGTEMNTAVWVGFIALFGIAVDDGVVIATYLDQVFTRRRLRTVADIRAATVAAGARRIRPCLMTTATTVLALVPVLLAEGRGADVARAMALPVFGGMTVELVTLFVVPVLFCGFMEFKLRAGFADRHWAGTEDTPAVESDDPAAARIASAAV